MARKHIQQMSKAESAFIHGWLRSSKREYTGTAHYTDRASERHFTFQDVVQAVRTGLVVEVHNDKALALRAVVRDSKGTCVVVELTSQRIISVYYNDPEDKHDTINWAPYRWNQDIVELVKSL